MRFSVLALLCLGLSLHASAQTTTPNIPIDFDLPQAGYVTIVIEDPAGNRIRNLIQETYFAAGPNTVYWDGYDEGVPADRSRPEGTYVIERALVTAGDYVIKALYHEGISLEYEFSVQSPGNTPWRTPGQSGAWFSDHQSAHDVVFLPAGSVSKTDAPVLFFSARKGEAGHAFMQIEEDGRKVFGEIELPGDQFLGGHRLARDMGPEADEKTAVYIATANRSTLYLSRWNQFDDKINQDPVTYAMAEVDDEEGVKGAAAYNQVVAVSLPLEDKIVFIDDASGTVVGEAAITDPRGLYVTDSQQLYVATTTQVRRYDADFTTGTLTNETVLVTGLQDPQGLTIAGSDLYVTDWGTSHQVQVYDLTGTFQRVIGGAGGPMIGTYDETRMGYPRGVAVDSQGKLWVAERHKAPKRISRWDAATGTFDRAWYGPPKYGGGGMIDPTDRTRFYYSQGGKGEAMRAYDLVLDWDAGTATVDRILLDFEHFPTGAQIPFRSPEYVRYAGDRRYLVNNNQELPSGNRIVHVWLEEDDRLFPVAAAGIVDSWSSVIDLNEWPAYNADNRKVFFVWSDFNRDGSPNPGEVQYREQDKFQGTIYIEPDLSVTSIWGYKIPAPTIQSDGVPVYDIDAWTTIAPDAVGDDKDSYHLSDDSLFVSFLGPFSIYNNGQEIATYHVQWPNRNLSGDEVPTEQYPGQLMETTRPLGDFVVPNDGESGPIWGVNGDWGQAWLFTWDGFFLTKLLEDSRTHPLWNFAEGVIQRGSVIEGVTGSKEQFWPTLNKTSDGEVYFVAGKEHSSILRVAGLETIQRLDFGTRTVTEADLGDADATQTDGDTPIVEWLLPETGAYFTEGEDVFIEASSTDVGGTVVQMEFLVDGDLLASFTAEPYTYTWVAPAPGTYTITGVATDNEGNTGTSSELVITVNGLPTVSLVAPADSALFVAPADVVMEAEVADDGTITQVAFFIDGTQFAEDTTAPFTATWSGAGAGNFNLTAEATDDYGETTLSAPVFVRVNNAPTVTVLAPADSSVFVMPAGITINAEASDKSGTVAQVELFANDILLTTLTDEPYQYTWNGAAAGIYALTAVVTDDLGTRVTSEVTTVYVTEAPTVSLTMPAAGTVFTAPVDVVMEATAADADGTVAVVEFFRNGTSLGTDDTAPFSLTWAEAPTGLHDLFAVATDDLGATSVSDTLSIEVNAAPTASLITPADSTVLLAPADVLMRVATTDEDGTVAQVDFYADDTLVGTATAVPFQFTWSAAAAGTYTLHAVATDDDGGTATTETVTLFANAAPTVSITAPTDGTFSVAAADIEITADATDADGTVASVTFFANGFEIGTDDAAPFSFIWVEAPTGSVTLTATATDDQGATTTSAAVDFVINGAPTATLAAPLDGAVYAAPADIQMGVFASDDDGTVAQVDFYADGTLVGTATTTPYLITWSGVEAGTYEIYAAATDDQNTVTLTDTVTIVVNGGPTVSITSPVNGTVFGAPGTMTFEADAVDTDGTVTQVAYFRSNFEIGVATEPPFAVTWTNVPSGTHPITAVATDDRGVSTTSAAIDVVVNAAPQARMTSPPGGATVPPGFAIPLAAQARDTDGSVVSVQFYADDVLLAEDTTTPYSATWSDAAAGSYSITAVVTDDQGLTFTTAAVTINVQASMAQRVVVQPGWNLISGFVAPSDPSLATVLAPDAIARLRDDRGTVLARDRVTDAEWDALRPYRLFATTADTLLLVGEALAPEATPLDLAAGWNAVPYLRQDALPPAAALATLGEALVAVKDGAGRVYAPGMGLETLARMEPGQGYQVYLREAAVLTYPANTDAPDTQTGKDTPLSAPALAVSTGSDATLVVASPDTWEGYHLAVLGADGQAVGHATVSDGRAVIVLVGDDPSTPAREGATPGEALTLEATPPTGEAVGVLTEALTDRLTGTALDALAYRADGLWSLEATERPAAFMLAANYPNPFNPSTTIAYALPQDAEVTLEIFNVLGQRVAVLVDGPRQAGAHEARWQASSHASGLYLYRLHAGSFVQTRTMLLLK